MKMQIASKALWLLAFTLGAGAAHAASVVDAPNDFLPSYTGAQTGDLDVLSSFVTYNAATDTFFFSGTFAAPIGTTSSAFYVWGVDRGQGTEGLNTGTTPVGAGVNFDSVVIFHQDGSAMVNTLATPGQSAASKTFADAVTISGNTISGSIDGQWLPSTGFDKASYAWNLWPRDLAAVGTGNAAISDLAPDASDALVSAVPEPQTYALLGLGLGTLAWVSRRRKNGRV